MADGEKNAEPNGAPAPPLAAATDASNKQKKREIKGGLPYTPYPNSLKRALDGIVTAERPDKFSNDFLGTVLKVSGGSARPVAPLLKKMHFIASDGTPTDLYSKFKTDSGRGQAALDGLRNAFSELFRRNESIYKADGAGVKDLVVEVTGLNKSDNIVRLISQTFEVIRGFADKNGSPSGDTASIGLRGAAEDSTQDEGIGDTGQRVRGIGLSYHINVVLPETENIAVFNAIFRSLRDNLLREL